MKDQLRPSKSSKTNNQELLIPPIQPFSPQEIYKFTGLDLALRSHPELAREGASLLNPRALAKLIHGIKNFQDTHLGRRSKYTANKSWPITKLPDTIFRSRSAKGPLFSLLLTSYRVKKQQNWKTFDFVSMNRYDDNILLLTEIEKGLITDGWLVRPICYFDDTVDREKVVEYSKIITRFGGIVVNESNGLLEGGTTIASLKGIDEKKKDGSGDIVEEGKEDSNHGSVPGSKRKKRKKNIKTTKKKVDPKKEQEKQKQKDKGQKHVVTHIIAWDEEEHDSEDTLKQEQESAYAHNYDIVEKLYLRTISVIDPRKQNRNNNNIVETNMLETKKKGGRLGGKGKKGKAPNDPSNPLLDANTPMAFVHWWYLPSSYDEFMLASDVDGDNDIPPKPDGGPWIVGAKFIRDIEKYNEWGLEEDYTITDYEKKLTLYKEIAKKKMEEAQQKEEMAKKAKAQSRKSSKSPTVRLRIPNANKSTAGDQKKQKEVKEGMNPRQIFTGYYDNRTKIKRTVHDGALYVPKEASSLIHQSMIVTGIPIPEQPFKYVLPKVGSVLRPSEDTELLSNGGKGFIVTELRRSSTGSTLITNRRCVGKDLLSSSVNAPIDTGATVRIRGGGENESNVDANVIQNNVEPMDTSEDCEIKPMETAADRENRVMGETKETTDKIPETLVQTETIQTPDQTVKQETIVDNNGENPSKLAEGSITEAETKANPPQDSATNLPVNVKSCNTVSGQVEGKDEDIESNPKEDAMKVDAVGNDPPAVTSTSSKEQPEKSFQTKEGAELDPTSSTEATASASQSLTNSSQPSKGKDVKEEVKDSKVAETMNEEKKNTTPAAPKIVALKVENNSSQEVKSPKLLTGDQERTCVLPSWYDAKKVSSLEMALLPEWFDGSSDHRTTKTFIVARERILEVASKSPNKYVTGSAIRRCVPGDAGSLMRMHQFLISWGFINGSAIGDSAPTIMNNNEVQHDSSTSTRSEIKWTSDMLNIFTAAVASSVTRKRKRESQEENDNIIDWDAIASKVGRNVTSQDCYNKFMSTSFDNIKPEVLNQLDKDMDIDDATAVTIENESKEDGRENLILELINGVRPTAAKAAIDASLQASEGNLNEAQNASVLAAVASTAAKTAREEEDAAGRILQEILDQRMSKLENRLSLLDDLECIFDAERMALELERRDLYTLRCRHWFSGDS